MSSLKQSMKWGKMKKYILTFLIISCIMTVSACSNSAQDSTLGNTPENEGTSALVAAKDTPETDQPDYTVEDGVLYVHKIYYSVMYLVGQNQYVYETPWEKDRDSYNRIVADAVLICRKDESREGEPYVNHSGIFMDMDNIEEADITLDMGDVKDASLLLGSCKNLKSANVVLTGNDIESAGYLFENDEKLVNADVDFTADNPEIVKRMFYGCKALKSGKVRASGNVTDCTEMYYGCSSMTGADVSFDIGPETQFSMMFGNCDSLNGVEFAGVHVKKGGQAFFNNVNSIGSYTFANSWSVNTDNLAEPIGDSFHDVIVVPIGKGDGMIEFNIYSKSRPEWYRSFIENTHDLGDWLLLSESPALDVYCNIPDDYGDISEQDVLDAVDNAYAKMVDEKWDNKYSDSAVEIQGMASNSRKIVSKINGG